MGSVIVKQKSEQQPIGFSQMAAFKTYRVIKVASETPKDKLEVGDIVVALPGPWSQADTLFNCTKQLVFRESGGYSPQRDGIRAVRDFTIESVCLAFDDNEMPA